MNKAELIESLRALAAEPAPEATDPWPAVRRQILGRSPSTLAAYRPRRPALGRWTRPVTAVASVVAILGMAAGAALFVNRPQPVSAAEVLAQVQVEAMS